MTKDENGKRQELYKFLDEQLGDERLAIMKNFWLPLKIFREPRMPFKTIYFLLTGKEQGIGLLELNEIYGKEFFLKNLKN